MTELLVDSNENLKNYRNMDSYLNTGVYFIFDENVEGTSAFYTRLKSYAKTLPGVTMCWDLHSDNYCGSCFKPSVKQLGIEQIVVVGDMPGMAKSAFSQMMTELGYNGDSVLLASLKEYGIELHEIDKAMELLKSVILHNPKPFGVSVNGHKTFPETLIIGAGIAGMQAALEIANAGKKVYLVEKQGTIGGHMAMFDKTFPTLDCAACILTPKMVEVGQHENIELLSYSEVKSVNGRPGKFNVRILKKARFVDEDVCIGCGSCSAKCPSKAPSEFDAGTTLRKAIYIPFPQAVPNKYLIDKEHCNYMLSDGEKCGVCVKFCPVNDCIDLHQKDKEIEITVGNIILATGFKPFDARRVERFGYSKFPNVLTSLEMERLINASGPTEGKITNRVQDKKGNWIFSSEGKQPKSFAIIHCIGSRDEHYNKYCSRVCCMYSLKLAHLVKEKIPEAKVFEYFIDMRAFGKGYEEFYQRIATEGVHIIRGRTAKIEQKEDKLLLRSEDILNNKLVEQEVDMAILSVGIEPTLEATQLAKMLSIKQDCDGWFSEGHYMADPMVSTAPGIMLAGVCQGPKDIPDTVVQASSAAARVLQTIEMHQMV